MGGGRNYETCSRPHSGHRLLLLKKIPSYIAWFVALTLFAVFRCFKLGTAFLPQVDEISLLNQANNPFLSGGSLSTTYFPTSLLTTLFTFETGILELRLITVLAHLIGISLVLLAARPYLSTSRLLILSVALTVHWYFNYTGRLFNVDPFTIFYFGIHSYLLSRWATSECKSTSLLAQAMCTAALGLDNYAAPWLYYLPFLLFVLVRMCFVGRDVPRSIGIATAFLIVFALPFIYVSCHTDGARDWSYLTVLSGPDALFIPSVRSPTPFLRTLTESFTYHASTPPSQARTMLALFLCLSPVLVLLKKGDKSNQERFVGYGYLLQLTFIFLSPIVPKHSGNFALIFVFYFGTILIYSPRRSLQMLQAICITFAILFGVNDFVKHVIQESQVDEALRLLEEARRKHGLEHIGIADGAFLKLRIIDVALRSASIRPIVCQQELEPQQLEALQALFLTSECEELLPKGMFLKVWGSEQLLEAHSSHGMSYFVRAQGRS